MAYETFISLIVFALVTCATPGPNNIMVLTSGVNYGFMRTIPHILGIVFGFSFMNVCVGFGLGGLFQLYPQVLFYLKFVAMAYLVFLSWRIAFSKADVDDTQSRGRPLNFIEAALFQWINPKAWAMALSAITIYVNPDRYALSVLLVGLSFILATLPMQSMWTYFGTLLRAFLQSPMRLRLFNIAMALLLLASVIPAFLLSTDFAQGEVVMLLIDAPMFAHLDNLYSGLVLS